MTCLRTYLIRDDGKAQKHKKCIIVYDNAWLSMHSVYNNRHKSKGAEESISCSAFFYEWHGQCYVNSSSKWTQAGHGEETQMNCIAVHCRLHPIMTRIDPQQNAGLPGSGFFGQWSPDSQWVRAVLFSGGILAGFAHTLKRAYAETKASFFVING